MPKNTKRVAGENLTKDAFAYVGDASDKATWKLPIKFSSDAKTKRHIRNAVARFDQTSMPNKEEKAKAWERIVAAAKKYGIQIADEKDGKKSGEAELQRQMVARADRVGRGVKADPDSEDPALAWDTADPPETREETEEISELPMLTREFAIEEMTPVFDERKRDDNDDDDDLPADAPMDDPNNPRGDAEELANEGQQGQGQGKKKGKKKKGRDTDTFDMSLSSETPVDRWFGREVLEHSSDAVDMSRAKLGLPFLDSHDPTRMIGIIEGLRVENKKLRGRVRFSRNAPAQMVKRDMQDGIRKFTSVGYSVQKMVLAESSKETGDTYRAVRWMPMEGSSVAIPADTSVGFGRAQENERTYPVEVVRGQNTSEIRSNPDPQAAPTPTVPAVPAAASEAPRGRSITVEAQVKDSLQAAAEVMRLCKQHEIPDEETNKRVAEGRTVESVSAEILKRIAAGQKALATPAGTEHVEMSEKEQREYNIARLILAAADKASGAKRTECLEMEISDTIERTMPIKKGGVFAPYSMRHAITPELAKRYPHLVPKRRDAAEVPGKRTGLYTGGSTVGQTLVFTEPGEFIQFLYNAMRVKQLGARTLAGLRDSISFPKQTGRATGSWVTENPGSDVADSNLTLGS